MEAAENGMVMGVCGRVLGIDCKLMSGYMVGPVMVEKRFEFHNDNNDKVVVVVVVIIYPAGQQQ
jgi:hypothetical protein